MVLPVVSVVRKTLEMQMLILPYFMLQGTFQVPIARLVLKLNSQAVVFPRALQSS